MELTNQKYVNERGLTPIRYKWVTPESDILCYIETGIQYLGDQMGICAALGIGSVSKLKELLDYKPEHIPLSGYWFPIPNSDIRYTILAHLHIRVVEPTAKPYPTVKLKDRYFHQWKLSWFVSYMYKVLLLNNLIPEPEKLSLWDVFNKVKPYNIGEQMLKELEEYISIAQSKEIYGDEAMLILKHLYHRIYKGES